MATGLSSDWDLPPSLYMVLRYIVLKNKGMIVKKICGYQTLNRVGSAAILSLASQVYLSEEPGNDDDRWPSIIILGSDDEVQNAFKCCMGFSWTAISCSSRQRLWLVKWVSS